MKINLTLNYIDKTYIYDNFFVKHILEKETLRKQYTF